MENDCNKITTALCGAITILIIVGMIAVVMLSIAHNPKYGRAAVPHTQTGRLWHRVEVRPPFNFNMAGWWNWQGRGGCEWRKKRLKSEVLTYPCHW